MKKKILDIMIDFETFGRQPNSVPINLAVVAWNRYAEENPFVIPGVPQKGEYPKASFELPGESDMPILSALQGNSRFAIFHFDICACLMAGMTVEPETQKWWEEQDPDAKIATYMAGRTQMTPFIVVCEFADWLQELKRETCVDEICIWAQGSDFDIAKLRWLVDQHPGAMSADAYSLLSHTSFRDARTVILELGNMLYDGKRGFSVDLNTGVIVTDGQPNQEEELSQFSDVYNRMPTIESWARLLEAKDGVATGTEGVMSNYLLKLASHNHAHNSIYDCMRSIYNVWWLNQALDTQMV